MSDRLTCRHKFRLYWSENTTQLNLLILESKYINKRHPTMVRRSNKKPKAKPQAFGYSGRGMGSPSHQQELLSKAVDGSFKRVLIRNVALLLCLIAIVFGFRYYRKHYMETSGTSAPSSTEQMRVSPGKVKFPEPNSSAKSIRQKQKACATDFDCPEYTSCVEGLCVPVVAKLIPSAKQEYGRGREKEKTA